MRICITIIAQFCKAEKSYPYFPQAENLYFICFYDLYRERTFNGENISVVPITDNTQIAPKEEAPNYDTTINDGGETIYNEKEVDKQPEFVNGGVAGLFQYIGSNMKYPSEAWVQEIEGTVIVQYVIEKNGRVSHVQAIKSPDPILSEEACRIIETTSEKWKAGVKNGNPVRVKCITVVNFNIR